jgi:DNA-binding MarR family transcriptional regulator
LSRLLAEERDQRGTKGNRNQDRLERTRGISETRTPHIDRQCHGEGLPILVPLDTGRHWLESSSHQARAMGKVTQMKQKQKRAGTHIPILPLGGSKRVSASDWRKDLVVSWLFQTCIRLQTSLNQRFLKFGMTVQEASVLLRCVEARQWSPGKLSVVLGRDKAMVTRFVDRLEAVHLITRERNPRDKRLSIIKPTGKGKRLAQDLASVFDKVRRELFVGTRERDIRRLSQLLRRLHEKAVRIGISANGPRRRRIGRRRVGSVGLQPSQRQLAEPSVPPLADEKKEDIDSGLYSRV